MARPQPEQLESISERPRPTIYVFDVDGVITHPETKEAPTALLDELANRLELNQPVVLNTGRSLEWLVEPVVAPLVKRVKDKERLKNFMAVGEMGGTWIHGNDVAIGPNGVELKPEVDPDLSVSEELKQDVRKHVAAEHSQIMFFDEGKLTMISVEMRKGVAVEQFRPHQDRLVAELKALLIKHGKSDHLLVHQDRIATNVMEPHVGKGFGIERMLTWLERAGLKPDEYRFLTFGDNASDIEMVHRLEAEGLDVTFVYVGEPAELEKLRKANPSLRMIGTKAHCDQGTVEFLHEENDQNKNDPIISK